MLSNKLSNKVSSKLLETSQINERANVLVCYKMKDKTTTHSEYNKQRYKKALEQNTVTIDVS